MADKYIRLLNGQLAELEATVTSAGAGSAGDVVALDGSGRLDISTMPVGVGSEAATIEASENLSAGDFVNVHNSTGAKVRKADASNGRRAHGFVLDAVTSGQNATVFFEGANTELSALTPGTTYFLSGSVAGEITATAPSTSGHIVQQVGNAYAADTITFEPTQPITLA